MIIIIEDEGVGMTEKQLNAILNDTKSGSTEGTENERGTGLGLILIKEYSKLNNVEFNLESKAGLGTKVILAFRNS
jgi:signal transduction histidine kinase